MPVWTTKTNHVDTIDASHVNNLQKHVSWECPEYYGAAGDGVTDDTAAIQAAIDSVATSGGHIMLAPKTYRITGPLELEGEITISGAGRGSKYAGTPLQMSRIWLDHDDPTCAIWIKPGTRGVILKDFYLKGNKDTAGATTGKGIWIDGSTDTVVAYTLQSMTICDFKECGVALYDNTYMGLFIDCHILYNEGYGVHASEPVSAWGPIQHRFYGCIIGNNGTADVYNDSNSFMAWFDGCTFCGNTTTGIYNSQGRVWVNKCYFEEVDYGIQHVGYGASNIGLLHVTDSVFLDLSTNSVKLTDPDNVFIGKNMWIGTPSGGHVAGNAYYGENNYIFDPSVATTLTGFSCAVVSPRQEVGGVRYGTEALRLAAGDHVDNELYVQSDDGTWWWYNGSTWAALAQALGTAAGPTFDHAHITNDAEAGTVTVKEYEEIKNNAVNKVTNGGFDSATTGWSAERATLASVAGGQSGNCLQLTMVSGGNQTANQALTGKMLPGATYSVSAYVKSGTAGDTAYQVIVYDTAWNELASFSGNSSGSWVSGSDTWTQPGGDTGGTVFLVKNNSTAGTMLFDSVEIIMTAIPATTNAVRILSTDSSDATATLGLMLEQQVEDVGTFTASHKIKVCINGTFYWLQLDAV